MKDQINWVYEHYLALNSASTPMSVGWSSKESQWERFKVLFSFIDNNSSLLDFGCGPGHLIDFIDEINYNIEYCGIDINPKYISHAIQSYPGKKFICLDIEEVTERFDYVVGSGLFCWLIQIDDVIKKIEFSYNLSKKGVIFNFLDRKSGLEPLNVYDVEDMKVRLSHLGEIEVVEGYLGDEDFTIYLKK